MKAIKLILCILLTSCTSHQEAIENADSWNNMMTGILIIVTAFCVMFFLLLGFASIREWLKKF